MYSLQVNRTSPDKVYTTIRNVNGDSINAGLCARYIGGRDTEVVSLKGKTKSQEETIDSINKDLENKTGEIAALKTTLASMIGVTTNQSGEINEKAGAITALEEEINKKTG